MEKFRQNDCMVMEEAHKRRQQKAEDWDDEWHNGDERPLGDAITDAEMNQFPAICISCFFLSLSFNSPFSWSYDGKGLGEICVKHAI